MEWNEVVSTYIPFVWISTKWMEWHGILWNAFPPLQPFYSIFHSSHFGGYAME